ncbi:MAG TPA: glycosyl hydrolase [Thermoanaerobaculia bacterium]|nr:glycosyl hydrolase [Thermoanaerobaculia bacterium]
MPRPVLRPSLSWILILLLFVGASPAVSAAAPEKPKKADEAKKESGLSDPAGLEGLKYRSIGPAWGGRVSRASGVPGDPLTYYAATASGGVWKSSDGGFNWKPVFEEQPISSIGSIAVAPSDPNVVYVGSGEANIRGNVAAGNGIYKSTDAGKTWTHVWKQEGQIGTMAVHPRNPDVAFAAVLGHAFGPNPERGVYRTRDGGRTWQQVLKKDADTGASDVALDPSNPNIVFAGLWQARRRPWEMTSGGPGSGLHVSRDGGDTWTQLTEGLPEGIWGKVGVAVAPSDGRRVYALIEAEKGGLFRSDDGGESWTLATNNRELRQRAWYYTTVTVSPGNPDEVWVPNVPMLKSIDGGKTFRKMFLSHGDHHDLWIDPTNPKRMIGADDGGVDVSNDGGETWNPAVLPIGQFYHISVDNRVPFHVAGALQDMGTAQGPSNSLSFRGITNADWHDVGGGEAGWVVSDPSDPNIVYAGEYLGIMTRYDHRVGEARNVSAWPDNPSGWAAKDMHYRFQWTAPIHISPHDPKTVYHGANVLFRTRDGGQTWDTISPDLTRDDESKQQWSGGPITGDNTGVETYCTIFVVAESPLEKGLIWAGSDDGLVHITRNGGGSSGKWENVTKNVPGLPEWGTVSMIEPSRFDAGTAYLVVDAHRLDDMRPYLWKTTDYGKTWKRLDKDLPRDVYLHSVREDPAHKGTLYLGTERGVAVSQDDGATWNSLRLNLPTVAVHDLAVKDNSLVLGTHGRSAWILDDLSLVREQSSEAMAKDVHLYPAPDAVRWVWHRGPRLTNRVGQNPAQGAPLHYWLKEEPKREVTIEILDANGTLVRKMSSAEPEPIGFSEYMEDEKEFLKTRTLSKKKGLQRTDWDLAWEGAELIRGGMLDYGFPVIGPTVLPGTYTVRLTADGKTESTTLKVLPDPRSTVSPQDLAEQLRFSLEVRDAISHLTRTAEQIRSVRRQVTARNDLLKKDARAAELIKASEAFLKKMDAVEEGLHNPKAEIAYDILAMKGGAMPYSRLSPLFDSVKTGDGPPTQGTKNVFATVKKDLDRLDAEWKTLLAGDFAALQQQAEALEMPEIYLPGGSR